MNRSLHSTRPWWTALFLLLSLLCLPRLASANPPAGFQNRTRLVNLIEPTCVAFLPDGRMLITLRAGTVLVAQPGATQVDATPFLQLSQPAEMAGERGMVGLAIDPGFNSNGFFYVFYTSASPLIDRVSRFTAVGNSASPSSEQIIWQDNEQSDLYHHGGCIAFGPDGKLYISLGDFDVVPSKAMDLTSNRGKILRVNSNGSIPTDNPFFDGAGPNIDAIWARGLRNPFRFSFDAPTGRMYIADVGANNDTTSIEEVNVGVAGANYGWPTFEGPVNTSGFTDPIFDYVHAGSGAAITGGFVYRGTQFPSAYQGNYFYGDYVREWVRRLTINANGAVTGDAGFEPAGGAIGTTYANGSVVDLKQGPEGSLYYVDIGNPFASQGVFGSIHQISYTASPLPVAVFTTNAKVGAAPLTVNFNSSGSHDPGGKQLTYLWDFGTGDTSTDANPSYTYQTAGRFIVRLTVSNGTTSADAALLAILVGFPPTARIDLPTSGSLFRVGDPIGYFGSAKDFLGATIPASKFSWSFILLHHEHQHPYFGPVNGIANGLLATNLGDHGFIEDTRVEVVLTVTDSLGLQGFATAIAYPAKPFNAVQNWRLWMDPRL